jgi:hypothetical protein
MTVDPDSLYERTDSLEGRSSKEESEDAKGPLDAEKHPSRRETTLREESDDPKHIGKKAVEGDRKEKLRRIQEAKEEGQ